MRPGTAPVAVVGAGIGGLAAAIDLAARGVPVRVYERAPAPGGKLRQVAVGTAQMDAGPTVFTMRWVFDELFESAGSGLERMVGLRRAELLARHAWDRDGCLDLYADLQRSADAIGEFAGADDARGFLDFAARARRIYEALERPFIRGPACRDPFELVGRGGLAGLAGLASISPFTTLWRALQAHFRDPRLRQLFGRYATYCGSSPFDAPATLMLVAHVELDGVWLVDGGMHRLVAALQELARRLGVELRAGAEVRAIGVAQGRAAQVELVGGERVEVAAVIANCDASALAAGRLGTAARGAVAAMRPQDRSLSAVTWNLHTRATGFPLARHTVFFSRDYRAEFATLADGRLPAEPTVYVCAQDRDDRGQGGPEGDERLLCLVNAPALGDLRPPGAVELAGCERNTFALLGRCGLSIAGRPGDGVRTTPTDFDRLYPGTGGALYGRASHGWQASFRRPGARTRLPGLYVAGGSAHPGPGVPMAALSGRLAAAAVIADLAAQRRT